MGEGMPRAKRRTLLIVGLWLTLLTACGPRPATDSVSTATAPSAATIPSRTVKIAVRYEVADLFPKISGPSSPSWTRRVFNASLALYDDRGELRPYLAEALPQLNTDSWRLLPDGRMETAYRLRPGLAWHDGTPLTADDFVFAFGAYTVPGLALFLPTPQDLMEAVSAPDARTLLIRWRVPYPDAGALADEHFEPLPRHIMEPAVAAFERDPGAREALVSHRFWTTDYVGAGPYRLVRWEPGTYLEGEAFDRHALGRPKIDRVIVLPVGDENTTLSNLLAGEVHLASRLSIRFEHGLVLRREWGSTKGTIFLESNPTVHAAFQFRPDSLKTPALLDVRVRKALAHSVDKEDLNQGLFEGEGIIGHSFTSPEQSYYGEVDRAVTKYPYDPRRTEQLMVEAGFARDRAGLFADASGQRFQPDFWVTAGPLFEKQLAIMTDTWQRAGIDVQPWAIPVAMTRDNSTRMLYPGILSHGVNTSERDALLNMTTEAIGTPANRFTGTNRGGWSNPEYDRLWGLYASTLDRSERTRYVIEIMQLRAEQLPSIMLFFNYSVVAHAAALRGPTRNAPSTLPHWNIHEWELA